MIQAFADRHEAGAELATKLRHFANRNDVVVLALPRGGVPVAFEVAEALDAPLDIFLVRKLGMPGHTELAMGAIASGGVRVLNEDVVQWYGISDRAIETAARDEQLELERREREYRRGRPMVGLGNKAVILVDDGLATGSTMRAAVEAVRQHRPARIIVAVPVGAPSTCAEFADVTDETICARMPEPFSAVGQWYGDFSQTTDQDVHDLLDRHERWREGHQRAASAQSGGLVRNAAARESITIPVTHSSSHSAEGAATGGFIGANLHVPDKAAGLVIFAHGSGSSRFSSRNRAVAAFLEERGLATLLLDLLTPEEESVDIYTTQYRFDIGLLGRRVAMATNWALQRNDIRRFPIGYFGASTGAAAALIGAAEHPGVVRAVVSRGGRPDLAEGALRLVRAPTLLIVGGDDEPVIEMNRDAMRQMTAPAKLEIVPGATHLFEEPGTLERVMALAGDWFHNYLG